MGKYLHYYESNIDFRADYDGDAYLEPWVSYTDEDGFTPHVDYNKPDPYNGHEYVDLGLPSGTKWATMNVGARTPVEYGGYYAWGETEEKERYSYDNYAWYRIEGYGRWPTKYYQEDGLYILEPDDDVATVKMGGQWHMPTKFQCAELLACCRYDWVTVSGVPGCRLTSLMNGNQIFFPAAGIKGYYDEDPLAFEHEWFGIWTSSKWVDSDEGMLNTPSFQWDAELMLMASWGLNGDSGMVFTATSRRGMGMYDGNTDAAVAGIPEQGLTVRGVVGNEINMESSGFVIAITAILEGAGTTKEYTYSNYIPGSISPYVWVNGQDEIRTRNRNPVYANDGDDVFVMSGGTELDHGIVSSIRIEGMP